MTLFKTLTRGAGLMLCVVAFAGTAFAGDNGNGNGNGNPPATPPGQEKKAEPAPAPAAAPAAAPQAAAPGQQQKAKKQEAKAAKKAEPKPASKPTAAKAPPGQAKKSEKQAQGKAKQSHSGGRSAEAHHHVIICHRTGSDSNPYVVINIPWTAWTEAHSPDTGSHPDLNGRHDIMLKDPASRPGSKDGFTKSACVAAGAPAAAVQQQTDVCPNIEGMQTAVPTGLIRNAEGHCVAPAASAAAVSGRASAPAGGVAGAVSPAGVGKESVGKEKVAKAKPASPPKPAGGVLGAVASAPKAVARTATTGTLPFTGVPLWIAALIGGALLATGLVLRRSTT